MLIYYKGARGRGWMTVVIVNSKGENMFNANADNKVTQTSTQVEGT